MKLLIKIFIVIILTIVVSNNAFSVKEVDVFFQQKIPMRDGAKLSADILLHPKMTNNLPTIFVMTPYTSDGFFENAMYFAKNGYNFVVVDCRGRGNSEGTFIPFENEGKDGYDVCKWIAEQPWSNGKIGMMGGSYLGMAQWLIMKEKPPALKTAIPIASVCPGIDFPKQNNIYYCYNPQWLTFTFGKTLNTKAFTNAEYWDEVFKECYVNHIPYCDMDAVSGIQGLTFQNWLKHPAFDDYYKNIIPSKKDFSEIEIPVLTITGHFDDDQPGAMYYYKNFICNASEKTKNNSYIIVGPWDHGGTRRPSTQLYNLSFGENSKLDMNKLQLQWFDHYLKNSGKPEFLTNHCMVYQMGTNEWKSSNELSGLTNTQLKLYLKSNNKSVNNVFDSGLLSMTNANDLMPDTFIYEPSDTTNSEKKIQHRLDNYAWRDEVEAYYPEKLVYHSEPLKNDMIFTGFAKLNVQIEMNVPDIDFEAILYEIQPDGKCIYLTSAVVRARYNKSLEVEELIKPGELNNFEINLFHFTSRKLNKDSRLRLVFGALNSPYFQKNYCSGKNVSFETIRDSRKAIVKIFHNQKIQSFMELPVLVP